MGANASKHGYEYSYGGDPAQNYGSYGRRGFGGYAQPAPFYGQAGYPGMYSKPRGWQQSPQIIFPLVMHPMQQISGPPAAQAQQPYMQVPQPQVQQAAANPAPSIPVPQVPQVSVQPQPQSQYPLSPGPANRMPGPSVPSLGRAPVIPGAESVIPRSFTRAPEGSINTSTSSSSSGGETTDPLAHNPLPRPPREADMPRDMLAGAAMAHTSPPPPRPSSPLRNPLPPPPKDVYTRRKYRPLLVGTAYADRQNEVFPNGWFSDERRHEREGSLGRVFERLNPFRPSRSPEYTPGHRRFETMPELPRLPGFVRDDSTASGSDSSLTSPRVRRTGIGRSFSSRIPFGWRRRGAEQMMPPPVEDPLPPVAEDQGPPPGFMAMPSPAVPGPASQPQPALPLSPLQPQQMPANPLTPGVRPGMPLTPGPQAANPLTPGPQPAYPLTPGPQPANPLTPGLRSGNPLTPGPSQPMPMPQPSHSFSPVLPPLVAGEGPRSPNPSATSVPIIRFDQDTPGYGGLSHISPHRVLYDGKLYPTAAHLFEAHRFIGRRNDLAKRVRKTETLPELDALLGRISEHTRHDWEEILFSKMEDVLYRKLVQHPDLRELLLDTGIADIVYADTSDPFWGVGEHEEGENELGKALMRVRERLRHEAADS